MLSSFNITFGQIRNMVSYSMLTTVLIFRLCPNGLTIHWAGKCRVLGSSTGADKTCKVGGGTRTPSEHCWCTLEQGARPPHRALLATHSGVYPSLCTCAAGLGSCTLPVTLVSKNNKMIIKKHIKLV